MTGAATCRFTSPKTWSVTAWANLPPHAISAGTWLKSRRRGRAMATDIRAELRFLSVSAQKVRLIIDMVRGKRANDALDLLAFTNKGAAGDLRKLLASAVANAEEKIGRA